jgi:hypothetical protein
VTKSRMTVAERQRTIRALLYCDELLTAAGKERPAWLQRDLEDLCLKDDERHRLAWARWRAVEEVMETARRNGRKPKLKVAYETARVALVGTPHEGTYSAIAEDHYACQKIALTPNWNYRDYFGGKSWLLFPPDD